MCRGKRSSEFRMKSCFPPTGTVTLTHPVSPCSTLQNGTRRCGPASSIGNPRREVPPPEKNSWLVGTKLPGMAPRVRLECCWQIPANEPACRTRTGEQFREIRAGAEGRRRDAEVDRSKRAAMRVERLVASIADQRARYRGETHVPILIEHEIRNEQVRQARLVEIVA